MSKATGVFVTKMSILAFVDNFGAGMAGGLLSYWFFFRFGVELKSLGMLFFISNFLAALSFLSAPIIARRIGMVKTMAFSHGLASMIFIAIPFAPTFFIAATLLADPLVLRLHGQSPAGFFHHGNGPIQRARLRRRRHQPCAQPCPLASARLSRPI